MKKKCFLLFVLFVLVLISPLADSWQLWNVKLDTRSEADGSHYVTWKWTTVATSVSCCLLVFVCCLLWGFELLFQFPSAVMTLMISSCSSARARARLWLRHAGISTGGPQRLLQCFSVTQMRPKTSRAVLDSFAFPLKKIIIKKPLWISMDDGERFQLSHDFDQDIIIVTILF